MKTKLCQESMSCFDCPNHIQDPYTADYCIKFDCYCADAKNDLSSGCSGRT